MKAPLTRLLEKLLTEREPEDPTRAQRVARIKQRAELRRRRRNSNRLLTWTGRMATR